jgi:transcriptional regulator with PAS, ATPase and Fis domain
MRKEVTEMKKLMVDILRSNDIDGHLQEDHAQVINRLYTDIQNTSYPTPNQVPPNINIPTPIVPFISPINTSTSVSEHEEIEEENLSLMGNEKELILKALEKYRGRRKNAAKELGISERTLYRKIKEYSIPL